MNHPYFAHNVLQYFEESRKALETKDAKAKGLPATPQPLGAPLKQQLPAQLPSPSTPMQLN